MEQIFSNHVDTILSLIVSIVTATGILGYGINRLLHKKNMIMEKKQIIVEQKIKAINEVIDFERSGLQYEILSYAHPEFDLNPDPVNKVVNLETGPIYLTLFENKESINAFYNQLCDIRERDEKFLSLNSAALLWITERYYIDFCKLLDALQSIDESEKSSGSLFLHGLIYSSDYLEWQKKIDEILVYELNHVDEKLPSHSGAEWNYAKDEALKFYERSQLKQSLNDAPEFFESIR